MQGGEIVYSCVLQLKRVTGRSAHRIGSPRGNRGCKPAVVRSLSERKSRCGLKKGVTVRLEERSVVS